MLNIMKKFVAFITISSIWLLPVILPEIQAQQTATPPSTAATSPAIIIEELKSRRIAIESMTDIDATVKTDSLKFIDRAIANTELAFSTNKKAHELSQLIQATPERLKILQAELEKVTREETVLAGNYEDYQSRLKALEEEFETAKKRVESAVLTEAIGLALRTQRLKLPRADQYFAGSDAA